MAKKEIITPAPVPHLVFGIDRSGSMISGDPRGYGKLPGGKKLGGYYKNTQCRAALVEDAYKFFVEDQLKLALPAVVSVYAHDDYLTPLIVRKPLVEAATVTIDPYGNNNMYGLFMELVNKHKNEEGVMLGWMVDGEDHFPPYARQEMRRIVEALTKDKGWFFCYVGVGGVVPGSEGDAATFGIPAENAIYAKDGKADVQAAAVRLSKMATAFRTGMGV